MLSSDRTPAIGWGTVASGTFHAISRSRVHRTDIELVHVGKIGQVHDGHGNPVGISTYPTFLWTERSMVSLGILDPQNPQPGTEVNLVWGEPDGGARSHRWLEPHRQVEVRAIGQK